MTERRATGWDSWSATLAASGLASALLYAAGLLMIAGLPGTDRSAEAVATYLGDHRTAVLLAAEALGLAIAAQICFAAALWGWLRRGDDPLPAANLIGLASAAGLSVLEFTGFSVLVAAAYRTGQAPDTARLLLDLFTLTLSYSGFAAALWTTAVSIVLLRQREVRAWLAWLGFASAGAHIVAAASLARSGFFSTSGPPGYIAPVLIIVWIGAISVATAASASARLPRIIRLTVLRR